MEIKQAEQLIQEIKQIKEQYQREVGSKGKPWPRSIQSRVLELVDLGFTIQSISDDTGIPYYSILNWRHRRREKAKLEQFRELAVTMPPVTGSVAVPESSPKVMTSASVRVTTPGGYQIEANDAADVVKILRAMTGGG